MKIFGVFMACASFSLFAGEINKSVPFVLDEWIKLEISDGPVTIHRFRIEKKKGGITKSKLMRPGNAEFLETIQIQIEYSNKSSRDWEADMDITWIDANGKTIDGYRDDEDLDDEEQYDQATVMLSTLKYGLERAKTLKIHISFEPE